MSQQKKYALLSWLSKVLRIDITQPSQLRDGELLTQLCNKIPGINLNINSKYEDWKDGYIRLKAVHEEISSFMKSVLKYEFPKAIETINLVQMAKGQDDQGLISVLGMIFLVSSNLGRQNSEFVEKAMMLSQQHQKELYEIVMNNVVPEQDSGQMQQFEQKYYKQRQQVASLINALQSLSNQNQSLRQALISQSQQTKKLHQQLKKTEQQKDKLKRQLIQAYNQQQQQQPPSHQHFDQHHQQMIQMLKQSMVQQQQSYSQQIYELKEKIQSLDDQLDIYKNKVSELEENNFRGIVDHGNCVNLQVYKKQKNQLTTKLTEASSKEWKTKLENIRLQNLVEELKEKNKKLAEQTKNKENNPTCSKNDANRLKLQFYTQIRDKLKQKIQANAFLSNQPKKRQSQQENLHGMIISDDL